MLFFAGLSIYLFNQNEEFKRQYNDIKKDYEELNFQKRVLNDQNDKLNEKAKYLDNNVAFLINGYPNYYFDYNCMTYKSKNNNLTGEIIHKESAKSKGYIEYSCYNEILKDLQEEYKK